MSLYGIPTIGGTRARPHGLRMITDLGPKAVPVSASNQKRSGIKRPHSHPYRYIDLRHIRLSYTNNMWGIGIFFSELRVTYFSAADTSYAFWRAYQ